MAILSLTAAIIFLGTRRGYIGEKPRGKEKENEIDSTVHQSLLGVLIDNHICTKSEHRMVRCIKH